MHSENHHPPRFLYLHFYVQNEYAFQNDLIKMLARKLHIVTFRNKTIQKQSKINLKFNGIEIAFY